MAKRYIDGTSGVISTTKYIKGTSNLSELVLDIDSLVIPSTAAGVVTLTSGELYLYEVTLSLYYQNSLVNINDYTITYTVSDAGVTYVTSTSGNSKKISVSGFADALDSGFITMSVVADGKTLTKRVNLTKAKQGATGSTGATGATGAAGTAGDVWTTLTATTDYAISITEDGCIDLKDTSAYLSNIVEGTVIRWRKGGSGDYNYGLVADIIASGITGYATRLVLSCPTLVGGIDSLNLFEYTNANITKEISINIPGSLATILDGATSGNILAGLNTDAFSGVHITDDAITWIGGRAYLVAVYAGLQTKSATYDTLFNIQYEDTTYVMESGNYGSVGDPELATLDETLETLTDWGMAITATLPTTPRVNHGDKLTIPVNISNVSNEAVGLSVTLIFVKDIF